MTAEGAQNREEDIIMIESSDEEAEESNEYSPKNLLKYEFNLLFSLRRLAPTDDLSKDFCFTTAASRIRGADPFKTFIKKKEKEMQRKRNELDLFEELPYELRCNETARLSAEAHFFNICERIYNAKSDELYSDKDFRWFVESFKPGWQFRIGKIGIFGSA